MFSVSTVLLILATICLICMAILTGLVIYRRSQLQKMHFHGICGIPYDNSDENKDDVNAFNQKLRDFFNDLENV